MNGNFQHIFGDIIHGRQSCSSREHPHHGRAGSPSGDFFHSQDSNPRSCLEESSMYHLNQPSLVNQPPLVNQPHWWSINCCLNNVIELGLQITQIFEKAYYVH